MDLRRISDTFSVSPQIAPQDARAIKEAGFRTILCNRPDGEEPGQSACAQIKAAADAVGLAFRSVPITAAGVSAADMADFNAALSELPAPVLAYCRSGTRCTMLWSMSQSGQMTDGDIVAATAAAGYDMRAVVAQMAGQGGGSSHGNG